MTDVKIRNKLSRFTVGIAGCGGLGSNCSVALARVGIGKLVVADFDKIELSNLNRQYFFRSQVGRLKVEALKENIRLIDPGVNVETHTVRLTPDNIPEIFRNCDVIVEAFDRADQKMMIIESVSEYFSEKPLISGSGMAGWGKNEIIRTVKYNNLYICGDQQTGTTDDLPPLAPRVGIVASMQANIVMEILMSK